jgi:hypothetical protein
VLSVVSAAVHASSTKHAEKNDLRIQISPTATRNLLEKGNRADKLIFKGNIRPQLMVERETAELT